MLLIPLPMLEASALAPLISSLPAAWEPASAKRGSSERLQRPLHFFDCRVACRARAGSKMATAPATPATARLG